MLNVTVIYHDEPEGWWAEVVEFPSLFVTGEDRDVVHARVHGVVPTLAGQPVDFREVVIARAAAVEPVTPVGKLASLRQTIRLTVPPGIKPTTPRLHPQSEPAVGVVC